MKFIIYPFLVVLGLSFTLLSILLAPVLPLFASKDGYLPSWLNWFQTYDNPLDGDQGFKTIHAPFKGDNLSYAKVYLNRVWWLLRNPGYTFDKEILGAKITSLSDMVVAGDLTISDQAPAKAGYNYITIGNAWGLYYIKQLGKYCFRVRLGWKLTVYADGNGTLPSTAQFVFSPRIVKFGG